MYWPLFTLWPVIMMLDIFETKYDNNINSNELVKINKGKTKGYACIIDRSNKEILIKNKIISQLNFKIETFEKSKLPDELKKIEPVKPGSRII